MKEHVNVNCQLHPPAIFNTSVIQRMPQEERRRYEHNTYANATQRDCSSQFCSSLFLFW